MVVAAIENVTVKRKLPKAVPYILLIVLFERLSSIGTTTILLLYFNTKLQFDQATSTALFHSLEFMGYFCPILGALLADSYFGIFKTIFTGSILFCAGMTIVAITAIELLQLPVIPLTIAGLVIAIIGTGCMRGNMTAFGGNQYQLPDEATSLKFYFTLQVFSLKSGALMSRVFSPVMRQDIKCFGQNDCYTFAFGYTVMAMSLGLVIFLAGRKHYKHRVITENVFKNICKCVYHSLKEKLFGTTKLERDHWLDYADNKFSRQLINDTKQVFRILKLFIPIPFLWAVYMQQNSRWVFQATRMNGDIGFYHLKPDQMVAFNPIFSIVWMPICNNVIYPLLSKIKLSGLLTRIAFGGFITCIAFSISIYVETVIQRNYISMLWLVPQYSVLALAENLFFVSIINFTYNEGPANMKSVMTALSFTTVAVGNLIITIVSGAKLFSSQVYEFAFFVTFLFFDLCFFVFLAMKFRKAQRIAKNNPI